MDQFNITVKELKRALEFALENGDGDFGTVTLHIYNNSGIGDEKVVSNTDKSSRDITETEAW